MFEFADKFRGKYDDSIEVVRGYYPSLSGYKDELLWAALWLYKATGEAEYYNYVLENAHSFGGIGWEMTEFSWDVKYAGVQVMASMVNLCPKLFCSRCSHIFLNLVPIILNVCSYLLLVAQGGFASRAEANTPSVPLKSKALHLCMPKQKQRKEPNTHPRWPHVHPPME